MNAFEPIPPEMRTIASICRCATPQIHADRAVSNAYDSIRSTDAEAKRKVDAVTAEFAARTPDPDKYAVERVQRVGDHLVMQVRYPNCRLCEFEGKKTMVFLRVTEVSAIQWRRIDPHFREPIKIAVNSFDAPSPAARFPGNDEGWGDAIAYATRKQ